MTARAPAKPTERRAPAGVDPRMRDRRVSVQRTAGRRRLRRFLVVVVVLGVIGGAIAVVLSPLLALDDVTVVGAGDRAAEVQRVADEDLGSALLLLDTGAVARRVELLPWVVDARVERELPNSLRIVVTERTPAGWARAADGSVALVDARGFVLGVVPAPPDGMPELRGVSRVPPLGGRIAPTDGARVAAALDPLAGRIRDVVVGQDGQIVLHLIDGPDLRFGGPDRLAEKARSAAAVLQAADPSSLTYVDVRVPSAPVTG